MPTIEPLAKAYAKAVIADMQERYGQYCDDLRWGDIENVINEAYESGYRYKRAERKAQNESNPIR